MEKKIQYIIFAIAGILLFLGGMASGYFLDGKTPEKQLKLFASEEHKKGKLTSPLLACDIMENVDSAEFDVFKNSLQSKIDEFKSNGKVTFVAVYLRHMLDGAWTGINLTEKFTPASLLKVADMMTIYKLADEDRTILDKKILYDKKYFTGVPYFEPNSSLELGKQYTVDELVHKMVQFSDNEAMFLLRSNFETSLFDRLYLDLKIIPPDDKVSDDFMTIKNYSSFFRVLYNASYLSESMSEKALALLSGVSFQKGMTSNLPTNITVAHKFGERLYTDDNTKQLHDCGIIYHPTDPYLLCIMTRGHNYDTLARVIAEVSKMVWDEMQTRSSEATQTPTP